jgi:S-adenosylmethionine/arginine decarboxylase-like enzyme
MARMIASFSGCDRDALADIVGLMKALRRACAAAGATGLQSAEERFTPDGFVAAVVTRESRANLRTVPAHAACFVEFRCSDGCDAEAFAIELGAYLRATGRRPHSTVAIHRAPMKRLPGEEPVPRSA